MQVSPVKRAFDLILSAIGLVLAAPVILGCVIAVRLDSPGPGIFRQIRVGRHEKPFTCLKLRTMYQDTRHAPSHEVGVSSVTAIGLHLRRLKLDELPQLWNILVGEMSFVGPRPCLPSQTDLVVARRQHGLQKIRPGMTGISQVAGIDMSDPERLASLDATYLHKMSIATDIRLIAATMLGSGQGDRVDAEK
jgi:O-antigen biosynthesis protein WbqP